MAPGTADEERANGEHVALFVVDTQGLFDNETTMGLTAAIFGMSTLLSSYSIYNVSKVSEERAPASCKHGLLVAAVCIRH